MKVFPHLPEWRLSNTQVSIASPRDVDDQRVSYGGALLQVLGYRSGSTECLSVAYDLRLMTTPGPHSLS